jgi:hypothetical protein
MQTETLTVALPSSWIEFIEHYKATHQVVSEAQVIEMALELLKHHELEAAYREASKEIDPAWEITITDGLENETW